MEDHVHAEFGIIDTKLTNIEKKQDVQTRTLDKIFARIEGRNGITSEIAVLKNQFLSIPSLRVLILYASIGGGISSATLFIIKSLMK